MLIASKYEEIWAPEIRDFVYISDKAYTREQIISMEKVMVNTLGFNFTLPTPYNFLARFPQGRRGAPRQAGAVPGCAGGGWGAAGLMCCRGLPPCWRRACGR